MDNSEADFGHNMAPADAGIPGDAAPAHPNHGARVRYLATQLADVLAWLNVSEDPAEQEAAGDIDRALDRIDSAVTSLRTDEDGDYDEDADDPECEHPSRTIAEVCGTCGETIPLVAGDKRARFHAAYTAWHTERVALSLQEERGPDGKESPPVDWDASDDAAVDLLEEAAALIVGNS